VGKGYQLRLLLQKLSVFIKVKQPIIGNRDKLQAYTASLCQQLPGHEVGVVLELRDEDGVAGADVLTAERARIGDVLQVLAAVTDIVPDDSWLTELSLHQGKLGISGQSPAAARLIPALAADPAFRNPAFAAPVTRAPDGHADLFVIRAELAP